MDNAATARRQLTKPKWRIYAGPKASLFAPSWRWYIRRFDGTGWWDVGKTWQEAVEKGWRRAKELGLCS